MRQFIAVDPATGCHLRPASAVEIVAYLDQVPPHGLAAFRRPVRVGGILVDEDTGPGLWFGGAGF